VFCSAFVNLNLFQILLDAQTSSAIQTHLAPIKAVSSQRSEEIKPKAGITIQKMPGQFASKTIYLYN
jgi:hypothetical protein